MVQNIEEIVHKLRSYNNRTFPIVSAYLQIPQQSTVKNKTLKNQFKDLVKRSLTPKEMTLTQQDLSYIEGYLSEYKNKNGYKSLAIFSGDNKLWEVITIDEELPTFITVRHSPYLKPLVKTLSKYRRFLVVLADRQKALYFTLYMGQLETQGGVHNPSMPQKIRSNGNADKSKNIDNHIQDHLHRHLLYIGKQVNNFTKGKYITGVIIGGHKEIMHNIKEHLPKHLQSKFVGEFISELNINTNEILKETNKLINQINNKLNQQQILSIT